MSEHLESVVRPFQLPEYSPTQIVPVSGIVPAKNTILSIGRAGQIKQMGGHVDVTITFYMKKVATEEPFT